MRNSADGRGTRPKTAAFILEATASMERLDEVVRVTDGWRPRDEGIRRHVRPPKIRTNWTNVIRPVHISIIIHEYSVRADSVA